MGISTTCSVSHRTYANVTKSRFLSAGLEVTEILFLITWSFFPKDKSFLFNIFLGEGGSALCEETEFFLYLFN